MIRNVLNQVGPPGIAKVTRWQREVNLQAEKITRKSANTDMVVRKQHVQEVMDDATKTLLEAYPQRKALYRAPSNHVGVLTLELTALQFAYTPG